MPSIDGLPTPAERLRRKNVPGGRTGVHKVKTTPEEESVLAARASAARVTIPRLMVESAMADRGESATDRTRAATEMFAAYRQLAALGNNINQIARATNATDEVQDDCARTLAAVRRSAMRIDDVLDRYDAR